MLEIVERFISISGEAPIIGHPIYIYRFSGCNLNCLYCDTKYKDEVNLKLSVSEIIEDLKVKVKDYPSLKILFTGGEPLLKKRDKKLYHIIESLLESDFYIETNGSAAIPENPPANCHFVCDYKSPASGEENSFFSENLKRLRPSNDCIKFVIGKGDLGWLKHKVSFLKSLNKEIPLYVSPIYGNLDLKCLTEFILKNKLPVNISLQLHKIIWPDIERGV